MKLVNYFFYFIYSILYSIYYHINKFILIFTDDCDFKDPNVLTINKKPKTLLFNIREYLANYQESNGIPRTEYPFTDLVKVMGQATGRSLIALLYVIINTAPIVEVIKTISQRKTLESC